MKLLCHVAMIMAVASAVLPARAASELDAEISSSESAKQKELAALPGRWVRLDGGYVISINAIGATGKLDASYSNPKPLPFHAAAAKYNGGTLKLSFELRAGGYNGSTYTLTYDAKSDQLKGSYYQAVANQTFEVAFVRK